MGKRVVSNLSLFPDVNVWLALSYPGHGHHASALAWWNSLSTGSRLVFCRQTQMGFFRLMATKAICGQDVRTQKQYWAIFDEWIGADRAVLLPEPKGIDALYRLRTDRDEVSPKEWTDAYLAALAEAADLTLVTFDRALAGKAKRAVLLG